MLRILHLGDLHLGSALTAFPPLVAARRRERQFAALAALLEDTADVDAILIAGDVFDTPDPDGDVAARFFSLLGGTSLPVVIAPGNHDYRRAGGVWDRFEIPQNVFVFETGALTSFSFPALPLTVYGFAFTGEKQSAPPLGAPADRTGEGTDILLCHGDLYSPLSPYAPLSAEELAAAGFSYVALGHIHNPQKLFHVYGESTVAYSGFFAGRGFDEQGRGRALLVEIEEGRTVRVEPIFTEADTFEEVNFDCDGMMSGEEVRAALAAHVAALDFPDETALRVVLTGNVGLNCHPDPAALAATGARFALFAVTDETLPVFDAAYLEKDPTMRGAFYRAMLPRLGAADSDTRAVAAAALRMGLSALAGKEV